MLKTQVARLPAPSIAVYVTIVIPDMKISEGLRSVVMMKCEKSSVAVGGVHATETMVTVAGRRLVMLPGQF